jgi:carboxyl-terminal processing protease
MGQRWRSIGLLALVSVVLAAGVLAGIVLDRRVLLGYTRPDGIPPGAETDFRLMAEAWDLIDQVYVDRAAVEQPARTYGAISGMVDGLGDVGHSRFLNPDMVRAQRIETQGEFEGIGAYVEMRDGLVVIVAPIDGSPAQAAGLSAGDIILEVDGEGVAGMPLDEVVAGILGPAGTEVSLTILDPATGATSEVSIVRASVKIRDVSWERLPGTTVALVRIARFSKGVTDDLTQALDAIHEAEMTGLILDLRNNPGGILAEAVGVASQFLGAGNVLLERDAEDAITPVPVEPGGSALNTPIVALVNGGSASAAEIVAGALQDAERARLVGERTFGTGTVLQEYSLSDGSALLLAVKEWLTPNGRVIWREGLPPDVVVILPPESALLVPAAVRGMTPEELLQSGDTQVLRALELVQ